MKHDRLCAIGHNLADSLASGLCFVIGYWKTDVFGEAVAGGEAIEVDFLNGRIIRGICSDNLRSAAVRFAEVLPSFCRNNGAEITDFAALSASFGATGLRAQVLLKVADRDGRQSITEYAGFPLKRLKILDSQGRIRRVPRRIAKDTQRPSK